MKLVADRLAPEEVEHGAGGDPTRRRVEEREEGVGRGALGAEAAVGDAERERGVVPGVGGEDGLDERRVRLDVGGHHDHVARLEPRVVVEHRQDLIAEHLDLAHRAVADVDGDRAVTRGQGQGRRLGRAGAPVAQREDVGLDGGEHRDAAAGGLDVEVAVVFVVVDAALEHELEVAAQLPERREQGVALLDGELVDGERVVAAAPRERAGDLAPAADLRPVLARRAEQEQVDVEERRQRGEDLDEERREVSDPEHAHAARQPARRHPAARDRVGEVGGPAGEVARASPRDEGAPQGRLPALVGARLPGQDAVRPVDRVLVEDRGDARGELHAPLHRRARRQVAAELGELGLGEEPREHRRDGPPHRPLREHGRCRCRLAEHGGERGLDELARERELCVGPHAEAPRELHRQPPLHALALDDDDLGIAGRRGLRDDDPRQRLNQRLEPVAAVNEQARCLLESARAREPGPCSGDGERLSS